MRTIVTIEDDQAIRRGIRDMLRYAGFQVHDFADGESGLQAALSLDYDLMLLDLVLPKMSGLEILAQVRQSRPTIPIIILSAKGEESDRVRGLRAGADDYVVKPFGVDELLARIEAVLRRTPVRRTLAMVLRTPSGTVDLAREEILFSNGQQDLLTTRENQLLQYLATHRDRAVTRDELLANVWQIDPRGSNTRVVDMTISRLREKLHDDGQILMTVHGKGYMFGEKVHVESQEEGQS